ncbi:MAG: hypothetical protein BWK76_01875 [Desulfobulbaceae bacterium A2]|nr:MAG: hypothetical protein BWK76_01875 [Desulfobulbaceae bacterium A2]
MNRYLYDGSVVGLLSAIARLLLDKVDAETAILAPRRPTLFEEGFFLATDAALAERLCLGLRRRAAEAAQYFSSALLAEQEGLESSLLRYTALALRQGDQINGHLTHPAVREIVHLARRVGREIHRMKGLLRFEQLQDDSYLARMEPDHNILQPLAAHFSQRLRTQVWFIHDLRRHRLAYWDGETLQLGDVEHFTDPVLSAREHEVQDRWRAFFQSIAIPHRKNPRLQKSHMPMKYWKYLVERPGGRHTD